MITPDDLDTYPDGIDGLFQRLDDFIIQDYARRVSKTGKITETAEWLSQRAEAIGLSEADIQKEVARILEMSDDEIENIFGEVAFTSVETDAARFASAGLSSGRIAAYAAVDRFLEAAKKQTKNELKNITRTMGVAVGNGNESLTDYYQRTLSIMYSCRLLPEFRTIIQLFVRL